MNYAKQFNRRETPSDQPIPGSSQQANNGGGFSFVVDDWTRLDRFLILGADSGTYYVGERELVSQNHDAIIRCIKQNGARVARRAADISLSGRAPKNDPAIFALALVATHGDIEAKRTAFGLVNEVCRIGTHIFHFAEYCNAMRGWGRGLRQAIANWYIAKTADQVAFQAVKYRQRDGWTHKDLLRLSHPVASTPELDNVFRWAIGKPRETREVDRNGIKKVYTSFFGDIPSIIPAFEAVQSAPSASEVVNILRDTPLPWEAIPSQFLNSPEVWEALLPGMGLTALLRNLGKLTSIGLIKPLSETSRAIRARFSDTEQLRKARIHPLAVLTAQLTYEQGCGHKGSLTWTPDHSIIDVLNDAFYACFANVEPCGKPMILGLDVSGSMTSSINGTALTARAASAAMALVTAATEPETYILGFSDQLVQLKISPKARLDDVIKFIDRLDFGATDCAMPMRWALANKINAGGFVVYTDSETNCGPIHATQALRQYRNQINPAAKSVVVGITATEFSIADPADGGMLDVVGFDASAPAVISDFLKQ